MAHHAGSQFLEFSPAQPQLIRVPSSTTKVPLDLNLSQKVSQNFFKGNEEAYLSDSQAKSSEAVGSSHPKIGLAPYVLRANANGFVNSSTTSEQYLVQNASTQQKSHEITVAGGIPIEPPQSSLTTDDSGQVDEVTPVFFSGKQKSSRVEGAGSVQKALSQNVTAALEDGSSQGHESLQLSPRQKRKRPRIKHQTLDVTKKVILALEANEHKETRKHRGRLRGSSMVLRDSDLDILPSRSKSVSATSNSPDLTERRLLLEERKVRLAEQRLVLEEKKLEATIEIGKGLILSMERMTNTISEARAPYNHHR